MKNTCCQVTAGQHQTGVTNQMLKEFIQTEKDRQVSLCCCFKTIILVSRSTTESIENTCGLAQMMFENYVHLPDAFYLHIPAEKLLALCAGKTLSEVKQVLSIRSFQVIILQGVVGSLPWTALVFLTLWLQLLGFSDFTASTLMSCFHLGSAVGGALGGFIGDRMSVLLPNNGRIYTAQFSVFMGIPFSFILLQLLPSANMKGAFFVYALVMFLMSSSISWCGAGCNSPIFADIVPENLYSKIFAFDRSFEGAIAATAAPMVGIISEKLFGFKGDAASGRGEDSENAAALGNSLFVCLVVPWLLCFLFYFGLHAVYQQDRNAARGKSQREILV